jgi:hypothetical protein
MAPVAPTGCPRRRRCRWGWSARGQAELADDGQGLGGEGLVHLEQVDLVELEARAVEHLAHRGDWAHAMILGSTPAWL